MSVTRPPAIVDVRGIGVILVTPIYVPFYAAVRMLPKRDGQSVYREVRT